MSKKDTVTRAEIEAYARQDYKDDTEFWEESAKTATGIFKKLADYVVRIGKNQ